MESFDVLIVGGGMVGASLGCALMGSGLRVALVEAVPFSNQGQPSYDDRGLALSTASRRILEGIGVWAGIAEPTPIRHIHVSERGRFAFTRLSAEEFGLPALGHVVVARALGRALTERLRAGDCEMLCPATLASIEMTATGAEALVRHGEAQRRLRARLLVAADGAQSPLRDMLKVGVRGRDYGQTAIVANVTPSRPHRHTAYERFTPSGPLAVMPQAGNRCGLVYGVRREETEAVMALSDAAFLDRVQRSFGGRLGEFLKVSPRQAYPLRLIVAKKIAGPRFVILGNAAHAIHPNSAQGLNLGLRDVAALADLLYAAARGGEDPGGEPLTAAFARARAADHRRIICLSDGLARLFYNDWLPLSLLRSGAMLAVDILPPLKRQLVRLASGLVGPAPRLVRGLPL